MASRSPAVEPLLRCAQELREAFVRVKLAAHSGDGDEWSVARVAAQPVADRFNDLLRELPRWRQRTLRWVAGHWFRVAAFALWYRLAAFDDVEQSAFWALQRAARGEWTRRDMLTLRAAIEDARVEDDYQNRDVRKALLEVAKGYDAARKGKRYEAPAPQLEEPLTLRDQVDLRWLLSQDWQRLKMPAVASPTDRSASAGRHYLPWLSDALERLGPIVEVTELEEIAGQWRERRSRYFDDQPAEFIVVELLPRRPSTWWWRRWHDPDEPLPLVVGSATDSNTPGGADRTGPTRRPS